MRLVIEYLEWRLLCSVSPFDVTGDGLITPADVLTQIGQVNAGDPGVTPLNVLRTINYINVYGTETPAVFPVTGSLPAGESLGRITYNAIRPTVAEINVMASRKITDPVLVDMDGFETRPIICRDAGGNLLCVFRPIVDGAGFLSLQGAVDGPVTIWGWAAAWDAVNYLPTVRGFDLAKVTA